MSASSLGNRVRSRVSWKRCLLSCSLAACFSAAFPLASAVAADGSWAVDAAGNWIDGPNWSTNPAVPGGVATTANPDTATFGSVIGAARIVTVDTNRNIFKIDFAGNSSAYTLSGGSLLLSAGGSIVTSGGGSTHTDTISSPITLQGNATFATNSGTVGRILALTGGITGSGTSASVITLDGTGTSNNNTLSGVIADGAGGAVSILKQGTGTWTLGNTGNTFTGNITINGGTLNAAGDTRLGNVNNVITLNGGTLQQTAAFAIAATRSIKIGAAGGTLNNNAASGNMTTSAVISDVAPGAGALTITGGTGAYNPAAQHTYTGGTRLVSSLVIVNVSSVGSATTNDLVSGSFGTGTLHFDGASMRATTTAGTYVIGNAVQFNAATTFTTSSRELTFSGPVKLNGTQTINQTSASNINFTGAFSDLTPGSGLTLGATSTGRLVLSGANTYTGPTSVLGGTLALTKAVSLYNNVTASWTAANIKVASGGQLQLNAGGTGEFTGANIALISSLGNATDGLQSGAILGIDTTNATGAILDMSANTIVNPNAGANAIGINKYGASTTLVLAPNNSYSGATTVFGGTLSVASVNSVTGGTATSSLGAPTTVANGTLQFGSGTAGTGLTYTGSGETTDRVLNLVGTTGGFTLTQSGTGSLKFSSNLTVPGAGIKTITLTGSTAGTGEISGIIPDNSTTNTTAVTKTGTGTWTLSGANTYTGLTSITGGTLAYGASDVIATGGITLNGAGATLDLGLNRTDTVGVISLTNGTINGSGTSALTSTGTYALGAGVANVPLLGTLGANKTTTGTVVLNGASNYSGPTTIAANSGQLAFTQRAGFYGGTPANWTDTNFIVNSGSTLTFSMGGATGFTSADLDLLKSVSSGTGGFMSGSIIGLDTTAGDLVYGTNFANPAGSTSLGLSKFGPNKLTLTGAVTYTGNTVIDRGTLAIPSNATASGGVTFGYANTTNTPAALELGGDYVANGPFVVQVNSSSANTLNIASGKTLTVNGNFTVGTSLAASTQTVLNATGGGSLVVNNTATNGLFAIGGSTSGSGFGSLTTADFTALNQLSVTLDQTTGIFRVNPVSGNNVSNKYSVLKLPTAGSGNTSIIAKTLAVGDSSQNNSASGQVNQLQLGSGVNNIRVDTINIGTGTRDLGSITFGTANGSIIVRNAAGNDRATLNIANAGGGTGATGTEGNTFNVLGHAADLLLGVTNIGTQNRGAGLINTFGWDKGTLDMTSLSASVRSAQPATGTATPFTTTTTVTLGSALSTLADTAVIQNGITAFASATGGNGTTGPLNAVATLNIGGGTITIKDTSGISINMASAGQTAGANATANATINITGGATTLTGHIVHQGGNGTAVSTLKLSGGSLNMGMQNIGGTTAANNLTNVIFEAGTLSNVGQINNGAGLNKTTAGTLTIAGLNTYTGVTSVSAGVLVVNGSTTSDTTVAAGATLGGSGSIAGNLTNTGLVAPGNSIGTLTVVGDATFNAGSSFTAELGAGNSSDLLNLTSAGSNLSLATATDTLNLVSTLDPGTFTIINYNGTRSGTFDAVTFNSVLQSAPIVSTGVTNPAGFTGTGDLYNYGNFAVFYNNTDTSVQVGLTAIPEPSTLVLGSLALLGLAGAGIRRRRQQQ